jgi:ABC-type transport system involved in multi-copper enzyme maturation permease subunit
MEKVLGIAHVTILESFRRKDPFVVLILAGVVVFGAGLFSRFGTEDLGKFVKDVAFTVTTLMAIVICVITAARQIPNEIQNRTLYPLVAKPVSRFTLFMGKYVGVGALASGVVLLFWLELFVLFKILKIPTSAVFFQAIYLRIVSMWILAAMVLGLSTVFTHGANVTISLLLALAMQTFTNTMVAIRTELEGWSVYVLDAIYWIVPHLQLFDLSKKEVHGWPAVPLWVLGALTVYGLIYSSVFIALGCRRFSRLSL